MFGGDSSINPLNMGDEKPFRIHDFCIGPSSVLSHFAMETRIDPACAKNVLFDQHSPLMALDGGISASCNLTGNANNLAVEV